MTQEFARTGFWIPGGGVDPGEPLVKAVERECIEEAGVDIEIKGILGFNVDRAPGWRRIIFYGEPRDPKAVPKTVPDFESSGACWVELSEIYKITLRGESEPKQWFPYLAQGKKYTPIEHGIRDKYKKYFQDTKL